MAHRAPTVLIILDGFGYAEPGPYNPINEHNMPYYFSLLQKYPHTLLEASGCSVGLLAGMPGNSLVGHTTLGAGRVVEQSITFFHRIVAQNGLMQHSVLCERLQQLSISGGSLHVMGLLSDGASHSHEELLYNLLRIAHRCGITSIIVHPFLDGRDTPPRSAAKYLENLEHVLQEIGGCIGSLQGRSFAMDRTDNVQKLHAAFDILTKPSPVYRSGWRTLLKENYARNVTDEFMRPIALTENAYIKDGDGLIFFNIRADRARALTNMFLHAAHPKLLWFITAVRYHEQFATDVLYDPPPLNDTLPDILRAHDVTSCYIAETEKYAHVTYFFNGGKDIVSPHDMYVIVPSRQPDSISKHPELAARDITAMALCSLKNDPRDFYAINYANADLIGHTGDVSLTIQALQVLDHELSQLIPVIVDEMKGTVFLTADHGKAECMYDPLVQQPSTRHTTNRVPFLEISSSRPCVSKPRQLSEVAPVILQHLGIQIPKVMTHS